MKYNKISPDRAIILTIQQPDKFADTKGAIISRKSRTSRKKTKGQTKQWYTKHCTEKQRLSNTKNRGWQKVYADLHVIKPKQNLITNILYTYIVQADIQRP